MLTKFKEKFQSLILKEAKIARRIGLTPNHVSVFGLVLAIASGVAYWSTSLTINVELKNLLLVLGPVLLLASGFCDALDGAIARLYNQTTRFGGFLDSLLDRYADASVYIGLILGGLCDLHWGFLALVGSLLVSYARARAEVEGVKMGGVGLLERAERLLLISLASFLNIVWADSLRWVIVILAIFTNLTVIQRAVYFKKKIIQR